MKWKIVVAIFFTACFCTGWFVRNGDMSFKRKRETPKQMTNHPAFLSFCKEAIKDPTIFSQFKRHPMYTLFHENVTFEEGLEVIKILKERSPELLDECILEEVRRVDFLGEPKVYQFEPIGPFSPTTLLYLKMAGDIKKMFGPMERLRIVEIGGGSGGFCKVLHEVLDIEHYTIIDLPEASQLAKKFLREMGLNHVHFMTPEEINLQPYDLLISYNGFTESNRSLQRRYIKKLFPYASKGYLVCNFYPRQFRVGSYDREDLLAHIQTKQKQIQLHPEEPSTGEKNFVLTWGN